MCTEDCPTGRVWALTDVSLLVVGQGLPPQAVSSALGLAPSLSVEPGEDRDGQGMWRWMVDEHTVRDFAGQMAVLLDTLEPLTERVRALTAGGADAVVRVEGYAGDGSSLVMPVETLPRLAALGLPLELVPNLNDR